MLSGEEARGNMVEMMIDGAIAVEIECEGECFNIL